MPMAHLCVDRYLPKAQRVLNLLWSVKKKEPAAQQYPDSHVNPFPISMFDLLDDGVKVVTTEWLKSQIEAWLCIYYRHRTMRRDPLLIKRLKPELKVKPVLRFGFMRSKKRGLSVLKKVLIQKRS